MKARRKKKVSNFIKAIKDLKQESLRQDYDESLRALSQVKSNKPLPKEAKDFDGYPTKEFLEYLENWEPGDTTWSDFCELIEAGWWAPDWGFTISKRPYAGKRVLQLHTGGWSGNEETILALAKNLHFWQHWKISKAGGHFYFEIPTDKKTHTK